jgi:hypothetical protein
MVRIVALFLLAAGALSLNLSDVVITPTFVAGNTACQPMIALDAGFCIPSTISIPDKRGAPNHVCVVDTDAGYWCLRRSGKDTHCSAYCVVEAARANDPPPVVPPTSGATARDAGAATALAFVAARLV